MNVLRRLSFLAFACLFTNIGFAQGPARGVAMNADLWLSAGDIQILQASAAEGDPDAAIKLYSYYEFYKDDYSAGIRWMTIAAENGDTIAACNLAKMLRREKDDFSVRRASFWQKKCERG
jgi:TPR repeat protein